MEKASNYLTIIFIVSNATIDTIIIHEKRKRQKKSKKKKKPSVVINTENNQIHFYSFLLQNFQYIFMCIYHG